MPNAQALKGPGPGHSWFQFSQFVLLACLPLPFQTRQAGAFGRWLFAQLALMMALVHYIAGTHTHIYPSDPVTSTVPLSSLFIHYFCEFLVSAFCFPKPASAFGFAVIFSRCSQLAACIVHAAGPSYFSPRSEINVRNNSGVVSNIFHGLFYSGAVVLFGVFRTADLEQQYDTVSHIGSIFSLNSTIHSGVSYSA